jgi:predicted DNA-binding protein YlxM (UPF0122 family)
MAKLLKKEKRDGLILGMYDREWQLVNLSTIESIRGLLKYRIYYNSFHSQGICEEIICLYVWLDDMIEKSNLTDNQKNILNLYMTGHNEFDITELLHITRQNVNGIINSICKRIKKAAFENWKMDYVYWNKQRVDTKFKQCSKCKKWLPATEEYFSLDKTKKDGFDYYCKKCRSILKSGKKP